MKVLYKSYPKCYPIIMILTNGFVTFFPKKTYKKAGDGNRTHMTSLEGWGFTIKLRPQKTRTAIRYETRRLSERGGYVNKKPVQRCFCSKLPVGGAGWARAIAHSSISVNVIYEKVDAPAVVLVELADRSVLNLYYGKY
jgi:hypothetical protein